jgi:hypothetical protein
MPHAVVRIYANSVPVFDVAREHGTRIVDVMHDVPGLQMYSISGDEANATSVTITVCDDKTGTDESIKRAAALVKELLPDANIAPPRVLSGDLVVRASAEDVASKTGSPHLMLRLYQNALPAGLAEHVGDLKQALSAIPEWRVYAAFVDESTGHMVAVISADDAAGLEKIAQAQMAWGQAAFPHLKVEPPEVVTATRMYRFDATPEATPA